MENILFTFIKKILQNFLSSNEQKVTSNEQKVRAKSNEQRATTKKQRATSNGKFHLHALELSDNSVAKLTKRRQKN